jgi:hypothetical protein
MSCYRPITLKATKRTVPCGKCPGCKQTRAYQWAFRLLQEERVSDSSYFITLTYDDDHLPFERTYRTSKRTKCMRELFIPTLRKNHLQNFFKRLRYYENGNRLKYYAVGEYGGRTKRPHYHAIIFNAKERNIELAWQEGNIFYGEANGNSVGYCLKYLMKEHGRKTKWEIEEPEFRLSSQGLGLSYLDEKMINWHMRDLYNRRYCVLPGGVKVSMPRYYYDRLYFDQAKELFRMISELTAQDQFAKDFKAQDYKEQSLKNSVLKYEAEQVHERKVIQSLKTKL